MSRAKEKKITRYDSKFWRKFSLQYINVRSEYVKELLFLLTYYVGVQFTCTELVTHVVSVLDHLQYTKP